MTDEEKPGHRHVARKTSREGHPYTHVEFLVNTEQFEEAYARALDQAEKLGEPVSTTDLMCAGLLTRLILGINDYPENILNICGSMGIIGMSGIPCTREQADEHRERLREAADEDERIISEEAEALLKDIAHEPKNTSPWGGA